MEPVKQENDTSNDTTQQEETVSKEINEEKTDKPVTKGSSSSSSSFSLLVSVTMIVIAVGVSTLLQNPVVRNVIEPTFNTTKQSAENETPNPPFCFTVHFNGEGTGEGIKACTNDYKGLDHFMYESCKKLDLDAQLCLPNSGVKLFNGRGKRMMSLVDIKPQERTYVVPQGLHFVWPSVGVGNRIVPETLKTIVEGKPVELKQLSLSPLVFQVENFMNIDEITSLIESNEDRVKRSEVGFAGWTDDTRTSSTSWDGSTWAAKEVQQRAFEILGMDFERTMADTTQILRYEKEQWYKPHVDWFDAKGYDGHDPKVNNGTNRFATVFLYLSTVEEGGHTVFPLSTSHEGYNGEQIVHDGTVKTPGYIANRDARWACNTTSTALRSAPVAGNAVIFYNQKPDGSLDPYSLHGGCPVIKGTKWSANVWIWNRPKPSKSKAKDAKPEEAAKNDLSVLFTNKMGENVELYWVNGREYVKQMDLSPGDSTPMGTYFGHVFAAKDKSGKEIWRWTATKGSPEDIFIE